LKQLLNESNGLLQIVTLNNTSGFSPFSVSVTAKKCDCNFQSKLKY